MSNQMNQDPSQHTPEDSPSLQQLEEYIRLVARGDLPDQDSAKDFMTHNVQHPAGDPQGEHHYVRYQFRLSSGETIGLAFTSNAHSARVEWSTSRKRVRLFSTPDGEVCPVMIVGGLVTAEHDEGWYRVRKEDLHYTPMPGGSSWLSDPIAHPVGEEYLQDYNDEAARQARQLTLAAMTAVRQGASFITPCESVAEAMETLGAEGALHAEEYVRYLLAGLSKATGMPKIGK